jgi:hypothetical protein
MIVASPALSAGRDKQHGRSLADLNERPWLPLRLYSRGVRPGEAARVREDTFVFGSIDDRDGE